MLPGSPRRFFTIMQLFRPDNFSEPAITFKPSSAEDCAAVSGALARYFKACTVTEQQQLNASEIHSNNFKVTLRDGRVSKTVLVRRFKSLKNKEQIGFYLGIIDGLRLQGVAVSEVLRADDGALFVSHNGDHYAVFTFVDGDHFVPSDASIVAVAEGVSGMHRAFRLLGADAGEQLTRYQASGGSDYFNKVKTYSEGDVDELAAVLASGVVTEGVDIPAVQEALPLLRVAMRYVDGYKERIARLPKHVIHSDLHPHNVLMRGNELRAIIDFDSMRVSEQARDAAFFIYRFGRQFFVRGAVPEAEIKQRAARMRNLALQAYAAVQPLSSEELALMPVLLKDEMIRKTLFVLKGVFFESNTQWVKDLPKFFASLKEIDYSW